jgi:DNA-binding SARP family transcriptional activator
MPALSFYMFGKFRVQYQDQVWSGPENLKAQQLLWYLLINHADPHRREHLASLLWGDCSTAQSKKYLRKLLWQFQSMCESQLGTAAGRLLLVTPELVRLNPELDLWVDVADFEMALAESQSCAELDEPGAARLRRAALLYQGDLLEGCYEDWLLYERERLHSMYLVALNKLIEFCERRQAYEEGLDYGARILHYDPACERTHRHMMRLHYRGGNRSAAIRQYQRCVEALRQELGVSPTGRTIGLYEKIRNDQLEDGMPGVAPDRDAAAIPSAPPPLLDHLKQLQAMLADLQGTLQREIQIVEQCLPVQNRLDP